MEGRTMAMERSRPCWPGWIRKTFRERIRIGPAQMLCALHAGRQGDCGPTARLRLVTASSSPGRDFRRSPARPRPRRRAFASSGLSARSRCAEPFPRSEAIPFRHRNRMAPDCSWRAVLRDAAVAHADDVAGERCISPAWSTCAGIER